MNIWLSHNRNFEACLRQNSLMPEWSLYSFAQENEVFVFLDLLPRAAARIAAKRTLWRGEGRPPRDLFDVLVSLAMQHYFSWSARRSKGLIEILCAFARIPIEVPSSRSLIRWRSDPRIKLCLDELLGITAEPLRSFDSDFSTDASGASTRRFSSWFSLRVGKRIEKREHINAHVTIGVRSHIAAAVDVDARLGKDSVYMRRHVQEIKERFLRINDWCGDSKYLSRANCEAVAHAGGTPWFRLKKNTKEKSEGVLAWKRMVRALRTDPEAQRHYHKRSNSESTFAAKKQKFGNFVRSKIPQAQENEEYLKWCAYNFSVLSRARHEFRVNTKL